MTYFLSETYSKPKLVQNKLVKKIIASQVKKISWEEVLIYQIIDYLKNNFKIISVLFILFLGLYWRYYETQKKKDINNYNIYESESDEEYE